MSFSARTLAGFFIINHNKRKMKWTKLDANDFPKETVIAIYPGEEPVIGTLEVKNGNFYCVLPYMNTDDGSYYKEMVTHFISLHDFDHAIEEPW